MKVNQFVAKYANTPLSKRFKVLDRIRFGELTLANIYKQVMQLEEQIRPLRIQQDSLIKEAEEYLKGGE